MRWPVFQRLVNRKFCCYTVTVATLDDLTSEQRRLLLDHLEGNRTIFGVLERNGWKPGMPLEIDYQYDCPTPEAAVQLVSFLAQGNPGEVWTEESRVYGTMPPIPITLEAADEWVVWMIMAGFEQGGCLFDGWGTKVQPGADSESS